MPKERDQKMNRDERGAKILIKGKSEEKKTSGLRRDLRRKMTKQGRIFIHNNPKL